MKLLLPLSCALGAVVTVLADTEIRQITFPVNGTTVPLGLVPKGSPTLLPSKPQTFEVSNTSPEQFVILNWPEDEQKHGHWTVRLSWPGSSPTKWKIDISPAMNKPDTAVLYIKGSPLSPPVPGIDWAGLRACLPRYLGFLGPILDRLASDSPAASGSGTTANEVVCSVPSFPIFDPIFQGLAWIPGFGSFMPSSPPSSNDGKKHEAWRSEPWSTPFNVILEPVYFGIVTKSTVPTLFAIVIFAVGAWLLVPFIMRTLEGSTSMIEQKTWEAEEKAHREKEGKIKKE